MLGEPTHIAPIDEPPIDPQQKTTPEEQLLNQRNSLKELLGDDWKERCIFDSVEDVFTPEELNSIRNPEKVENTDPELREQCKVLNELFAEKPGDFKARVFTDRNNEQRILVDGSVGNTRMYQIVEFLHRENTATTGMSVLLDAKKIGFVSARGKVFSIDKLRDGLGEKDNWFILQQKGKSTRGVEYNGSTLPQFPFSISDIADLFHELGHSIRSHYFKKRMIRVANYEAQEINLKDKDLKEAKFIHRYYNARKIHTMEERGAWALCIALLREANKETGIGIGDRESIKEILELSGQETALLGYDKTVELFYKNDEPARPIPSFSNEERKAARKLQRAIVTIGIDPERIAGNFDDQTQAKIGHTPSDKLRYIKTILENQSLDSPD